MNKGDAGIDTISCPACGEIIPVNETIYHQITDKARLQVKAEATEQQKLITERENVLKKKEESFDKTVAEKIESEKAEMWKKAQEKANEKVSLEMEDLKKQTAEKDQRLAELQKTELEVRKQKRELEEEKKNLQTEVDKKIESEREAIKASAKKEAEASLSVELRDLKAQAAEKDKKIEEANKEQLELLKQKRELEEQKRDFELETEKHLNEERAKIEEKTAERFAEEHRLKDAEKDKRIQDILKINEELKRKAEQGSQQSQGEVLELDLEEAIKTAFPLDTIVPVPKGVKGADVVQKVFNRSGHECGTILWESKRTKAWGGDWIEKFKDDQRAAKADLGIIVSDVLPKDIKTFGLMSGVWVSNKACALSVAIALRSQLVEVAMAKLTTVGKNEKMESLYQYISGPEFRQRIEAIVETFADMHKDLQQERQTSERRWSKREKQIQRIIANTSGMYGDFQALAGSSLQTIPALELGDGSDTEEAPAMIETSVPEIAPVIENADEEDIDPASIPF